MENFQFTNSDPAQIRRYKRMQNWGKGLLIFQLVNFVVPVFLFVEDAFPALRTLIHFVVLVVPLLVGITLLGYGMKKLGDLKKGGYVGFIFYIFFMGSLVLMSFQR